MLGFAPGSSAPDDFLVGKSLVTAESQASASNQTTRIVAQDGSCLHVTADLVSNRVDLWIARDQVIKAVVEGPPGPSPA